MILSTLIFLAVQGDDVALVVTKFKTFMAAHPALSVDVAISEAGTNGTGKLILDSFPKRPIRMDWRTSLGVKSYRFIDAGAQGLDVLPADSVYDRHSTTYAPFPSSRVFHATGFPAQLITRILPFDKLTKETKLARKGMNVELTVTVQTQRGPLNFKADFGPDGRLVLFSAESAGNVEVNTYSNYQFGPAAAKSAFDVSPPIGYSPYAFDRTLEILTPGVSVPVNGLASKPKAFVVFIDDLVPEGLPEMLSKINKTIPVTVVVNRDAHVKVGTFPLLRFSEDELNRAGVVVTPQFYLVGSGKLVQAWQGFKAATADAFEKEVLTFQPGQ